MKPSILVEQLRPFHLEEWRSKMPLKARSLLLVEEKANWHHPYPIRR
ncbi:MAG: hypothetical protein SVX43_11575 [Cyanobacteriota bacterium]|nr:hypothetical protein [Cyanobacteriota bacterium]